MKRYAAIGTLIIVAGMLQACTATRGLQTGGTAAPGGQTAELNRKIDEINHRLSILQFMVDDHQKSIRDLQEAAEDLKGHPIRRTETQPSIEKPAQPTPPGEPPKLSASAEMLYNEALAVYKDKNYKKAATLFQTMADNYPAHDLADNALYWTGECRYAQKDYKGAIEAFKMVLQKYPSGGKVPDSLLKIGYAYLALDDSVNAQSFLKKVVKQYPFSPAGAKAGETLQKIKTP